MAFGKKKNKPDKEDHVVEPKRKSDKSIKPNAPRSMAGKRVLRVVVWTVMGLIVLKGCSSTLKGTQVISQINNYGTKSAPTVEDSIKGFATDFATEYFTWNVNNLIDHGSRTVKFVKGIDNDAGLQIGDIKGSSRVLSAVVYNSKKVDETHVDVTIVVRREFTPTLQTGTDANSSKSTPVPKLSDGPTILKSYMVVPVTLSDNGPVIRSYPRFVGEQLKGDGSDSGRGDLVSDDTKVKMGKDLAESFLRSWYEGNVNQLKYFYSDSSNAPSTISPSNYTLDKIDGVQMYTDKTPDKDNTMHLYATVIVKNTLGESFNNLWLLNAVLKDGKMYVKSVDTSIPDLSSSASQTETSPAKVNASTSPVPADLTVSSPIPTKK